MTPRIVSLLPSATEIVCALGLRVQLVGVTHECDYPADVRTVRKVTKTLIPTDAASAEIDELVKQQLSTSLALYQLDLPALEAAAPDLIISQTLCRVCAVADREVQEALPRLPGSPHVLYLEPTRFDDVLANIAEVAQAAGVAHRGEELVAALQARVTAIKADTAHVAARFGGRNPRVVVLEWLDPPFACGHWTPELVVWAGGLEPLATPGARSRQLTIGEIAAAKPDVLIAACCGYSAERTAADFRTFLRIPEIAALECVQSREAYAVDGSAYFSRPGPRLVDSLEILHAILADTRSALPAGQRATVIPLMK